MEMNEKGMVAEAIGSMAITLLVWGTVAEEEAARGDTSPYRPAHAGWVGITSYTDMHGNLRVKTETLVAKSTITADASDDTILPDS